VSWSGEPLERTVEAAAQPDGFRFQEKMTAAFDPDGADDRTYPTSALHPGADAADGRWSSQDTVEV